MYLACHAKLTVTRSSNKSMCYKWCMMKHDNYYYAWQRIEVVLFSAECASLVSDFTRLSCNYHEHMLV